MNPRLPWQPHTTQARTADALDAPDPSVDLNGRPRPRHRRSNSTIEAGDELFTLSLQADSPSPTPERVSRQAA
jgi:hypothetical protein